jgi:hypothetical protein
MKQLKETKTRKLIREIEKRGSMRYTEMQYFLWNIDHVEQLRPESKPSRGYWSTNLGRLYCSGAISKEVRGKQVVYTVDKGAGDWESFYTSTSFDMGSAYWKRQNKVS